MVLDIERRALEILGQPYLDDPVPPLPRGDGVDVVRAEAFEFEPEAGLQGLDVVGSGEEADRFVGGAAVNEGDFSGVSRLKPYRRVRNLGPDRSLGERLDRLGLPEGRVLL